MRRTESRQSLRCGGRRPERRLRDLALELRQRDSAIEAGLNDVVRADWPGLVEPRIVRRSTGRRRQGDIEEHVSLIGREAEIVALKVMVAAEVAAGDPRTGRIANSSSDGARLDDDDVSDEVGRRLVGLNRPGNRGDSRSLI